jgi:hypothetical protein
MVSWGFAFRKGLVIWLWSILWGIVGGIIGAFISGGSLFTFALDPMAYQDPSAMAGMFLGMMAGVFIGALIAAIGMFASVVKIVVEATEEAKR